MAKLRAIVTDKNVPEGHKGLHGFLYGEDGGDAAHEASTTGKHRQGEDDGTSMMGVPGYLSDREGEKPVGVYVVYDAQKQPQYVGYSRNMVLSIKGHATSLGEEKCAYVQTKVFRDKAICSRANLEKEVEAWLKEFSELPPGNGGEAGLWQGAAAPTPAVMSEAERQVHEEQKLKLRKAMGDVKPVEVEKTPAEKRAALKAAMEGNDWSAVISEQTELTIDQDRIDMLAEAEAVSAQPEAAASTSGEQQGEGVVSPFESEAVQRGVQDSAMSAPTELTVEAVQLALEEVRPYLVADGGDVEVVGVDGGVVRLELMGACSSCPSQSSTMQMGIERTLKSRFGDLIRDIVQVNPAEPGATVAAVDMHLNMLRGAVSSYGGSVEVLKVEGGVCELKYVGPAPIGKGLVAAVKDQFPDITEVKLV